MRNSRFRSIPAVAIAGLLLTSLLGSGCAANDAVFERAVPEQYASIPRYSDEAGFTAPEVIRRVDPMVADHVRAAGGERLSVVEAVIDEEGNVVDAYYISGDPEWGRSVVQAVRQWKFKPGTIDGKPTPVRFRITSRFRS